MAGKSGSGTLTKQGSGEPEFPEIPRYDPATYPGDVGWESLLSEADEVLGYDLAKEELFDALEGVPFMITRVTLRPGITRNNVKANYTSAECVIAPEATLKRRRVNMETMPFEPGELVLFNDGSTGIHRQIVQYLEAKKFISLPEGPDGGKMGESRFDVPVAEWTDIRYGELRFTEQGDAVYTADIRLFCKRGIRRSEYDNDYTETGSVTRYLA